MNRHLLNALLCASVAVVLSPGQADAQDGRTLPPPVSPYLNLLRRGNPTFLNYYGLVRPQLEFRNAVQQLQTQVQNVQQTSGFESSSTVLPTTGHRAYFINRGHPYFGTAGGQTPGGARSAATSSGLAGTTSKLTSTRTTTSSRTPIGASAR